MPSRSLPPWRTINARVRTALVTDGAMDRIASSVTNTNRRTGAKFNF